MSEQVLEDELPSSDTKYGSPGLGFPRRFRLRRTKDVHSRSGTGVVAYGVRFEDGTVVIRWRGETRSTKIYDSMDDVVEIHSHGDGTVVEWRDTPPSNRGDGA